MEEDQNQLNLQNLFNEAFMRKHSSFGSFEEFVEKGNFVVRSLEDVSNIHDELFDRHVARETDFTSWKAMLAAAKADYSLNQ